MNALFTVESPLGYMVTCSQYQWDSHILISHPNMKGSELAVRDVIENPVAVYSSGEFPSRDVYFGNSDNEHAKLRVCKVIVETNTGDSDAKIISAWMQPSISGNIGGVKYAKL